MISTIISLFTVFLYTALGTYVLTKNPHERTNQIFALLMLAFIIWAVGTFNLGIIAENTPLDDVVLNIRLELSGVIIALTVFIFFTISLTKTKTTIKNPFIYMVLVPSLYLLYMVWSSDISGIKRAALSTIAGTKPELFLFSTVFGVAGIYLLFKYYMTSKYRERAQAKLILTGAITAILVAVIINIILPMFFNVYFLELSTLAPAVMGIFFAYVVYQYGLIVRPMPELSHTSFCGVECILCPEYLEGNCPGCRFDRERYKNCEIYNCVIGNGYKDCGDCSEIITCSKRKGTSKRCFKKLESNLTKPEYCIEPGNTYFLKSDGYELFLDAVKSGAFGLVATTRHPQEIKEKYGLTTTPIVWISEEAAEIGVKPDDFMHLSKLLMNFMKKIGNAVVLLDGIDALVKINGFDNMQRVVRILNSTAQVTNSRFIILTENEGEALGGMKQVLEK
ncbi:MAG: DUF835 domain-containing protein [Candidatus Methanoperedens sp.]|nr:DUF835 domain-containing protein [Candidatus Methanoperedens sp.]